MRRGGLLFLMIGAVAWAGAAGSSTQSLSFSMFRTLFDVTANGVWLGSNAVAMSSSSGSVGIGGRARDWIVAIDGVPVTGLLDVATVHSRLNGPVGSEIVMRVASANDGSERDVVVRRQLLPIWAAGEASFNAGELVAVARLEVELAPLIAAVLKARAELVAGSFEKPALSPELSRSVEALANAELKLALAQAGAVSGLVRDLRLSETQRSAVVKGLGRYGVGGPSSPPSGAAFNFSFGTRY